MISPAFRNVLAEVEERVQAPLRVPLENRLDWEVDVKGGLVLVTPIECLTRNMATTDEAAASTFLVLVAAWAGRSGSVSVVGKLADQDDGEFASARRHLRRSTFLLQQFEELLPDRFSFRLEDPDAPWRWPRAPLLNTENSVRTHNADRAHNPEAQLAFAICRVPGATDVFNRIQGIEPANALNAFQRQLPVGLFNGTVTTANAWTPGRASAVDLWATTTAGDTVHLFELKAAGNAKVGIVPEALYYLLLLSHLREDSFPRLARSETSEAHTALARAERITMWFVAPGYHPLVQARNGTSLPVDTLNLALARRKLALRFADWAFVENIELAG